MQSRGAITASDSVLDRLTPEWMGSLSRVEPRVRGTSREFVLIGINGSMELMEIDTKA